MSRFFSGRHSNLCAYTPGEQPQDMKYIKLNTNESPFPADEGVPAAAGKAAQSIQLYSDPECKVLRHKAAKMCGVNDENILLTNGSDEILNFIFIAYGDNSHPFAFPDITYGFYPVFAELNNVPYTEIPLREDFTVDCEQYLGKNMNIVIANPNAPTGICLGLDEVRLIAEKNPDNIVTIDEAYVDFGGESAIGLTKEYHNLIVTQTFSKSRSMAGARLGFAVACSDLINDLNTVKYSTNPYNINSFTMAAGIAAVDNNEYYMENCRKIIGTREKTKTRLEEMGFFVTDSKANFLFAKSPDIGGEELYLELKRRGILIRHFDKERIRDFNRITIGTDAQMQTLCDNIEDILKMKGVIS